MLATPPRPRPARGAGRAHRRAAWQACMDAGSVGSGYAEPPEQVREEYSEQVPGLFPSSRAGAEAEYIAAGGGS